MTIFTVISCIFVIKKIGRPPFPLLILVASLVLSGCQSTSIISSNDNKTHNFSRPTPSSLIYNEESNYSKIPEVRIISNEWGTGNPEDILAVLTSVAEILFPLGGKSPYNSIWVSHSEHGPIVLYQRGKDGQYIVNLNTQDRYWCQYAFQFSHEIGHILCGYKDGDSSNLWFEETLGEVASLYALLRLEESWKQSPPYPHWKDYAPEFTKYAEERIKKYENEIPADLNAWFQANKQSLRNEPVDRPRNVSLAIRLLPLFDKFPEGWSACAFLNEKKSKTPHSFDSYLSDWYEACPLPEHKSFVQKIGAKFGFTLPFKEDFYQD